MLGQQYYKSLVENELFLYYGNTNSPECSTGSRNTPNVVLPLLREFLQWIVAISCEYS